MKTRILSLLLVLTLGSAVVDASSIHTLQVTIGASTTQVATGNGPYGRQVFFQNNAAHTMRIGDIKTSATRGVLLASGSPGGSWTIGPSADRIDLSTFYVNGTQNDVLDVTWID